MSKLINLAFDKHNIYFYPYDKYYLKPSDLIKVYNNLKNKDVPISIFENTLNLEHILFKKGVNDPGLFTGFNLRHYITIKTVNSYFSTTFINYFQEHNRMLCVRNDKSLNGIDFFNKNRTFIEKNLKDITEENIKNYITQTLKYRPCSEFSPDWAVYVIKFFKCYMTVKNVLDMSVGRGSRMVGAAACDCNYYGTDPNKTTMKTNSIIRDFINIIDPGKKIELIVSGFEVPWENRLVLPQFDLMFSSPPYFDLELFVEGDGKMGNDQSTEKYKNLESWLKDFLKVCMVKAIRLLRPGGVMAINIDNSINPKQPNDYVNPMLSFNIIDATYIGNFTLYRNVGIYYTVWCWQKNI